MHFHAQIALIRLRVGKAHIGRVEEGEADEEEGKGTDRRNGELDGNLMILQGDCLWWFTMVRERFVSRSRAKSNRKTNCVQHGIVQRRREFKAV
ncbi:hypothetical protein CBR_g28072 [Chara braunii]|uniref:Uncharacterized protein n=1 Tax=Chara braunii TaxID=69332 RepID=A0A388L984_CHABU|nr:hypothetical protein CBR_g28072 [Chara braunii]|eukprot:GBG78848.1 hypothetical protein CBR_g28072 [Chara braunii]